VDDFALTPAERRLFRALSERGVRFLIIGMGAALIEGAPLATQDIDVWFAGVDDARIVEAAKEAGGFWISGFGVQPPAFGGDGLSRIDVVLTAHGLDAFDVEYERALERTVDGTALRVLPLERVIASKRSTGRLKDTAQLPALEATLLAREKTDGR
jgi:predicted nucleotidyltransferase